MSKTGTGNSTRRTSYLAVAGTLVASLSMSAQADNRDRRVEIVNKSGLTLVGFYASNVKSTSWEEDILGTSILGSSDSFIVNIDDGTTHCLYDFKGVFSGGAEVIEESVDVCTIGYFTFR